jgi:hypothetical protein
MAKRQKKITTEIVGDEEEEQPKDEQEDSDDKAMEEVARDFADGERLVKLYRYGGSLGGRPKFLGGLAREDFNEIYVQAHFGGGGYFGRWKKKSGLYTRYSFDIEGEPKTFSAAQERAAHEEDEPGKFYPYLGNQGQEEESQGTDKIGMIDVLRMMAETRKEAREEMRSIIELMRPGQNAPDTTDKVFSLVEKIVPLIQTGGDGGGNPWLQALSHLKEPLLKIVDTIQAAVQKGPAQAPVTRSGPAQPVVTAQPHASAPEPQPTGQPSEGDMLASMFKDSLPLLVKAADEGRDIGLYCDLVLEQVPVFGYDRLRRWLLTAGCLDDLAKYAPVISAEQKQREWWEALRRALVTAINEELGHGDTDIQPVSDSDPSTSSPANRA